MVPAMDSEELLKAFMRSTAQPVFIVTAKGIKGYAVLLINAFRSSSESMAGTILCYPFKRSSECVYV
jgi:hypothetical protein